MQQSLFNTLGLWITSYSGLVQRILIEPSPIVLALEVNVLLRLERVAIAYKEQQIIHLHPSNLLSRHELLPLL